MTSPLIQYTLYIRRALAPAVLTLGALLLSACGANINEVANLPGGGNGTLTAVISPPRVVAGQIYTYQAAAPSGTTVTWSWGDGSPDTVGSTVQKVWNKPGSYTATLSATAGGKLFSGTSTVIVTGEALSAGARHTCALQPTGTVLCWGDNSSGQLGGGQLDGSLDKLTAAAVAAAKTTVNGLTDAIALTAGGSHTCAVKADHSVACWGNNNFGQLGNSSITLALSPTTVNGLTDAVAVSAGSYHTCALQSSGSVACWGDNNSGQLGNGTTTQSLSPVTVVGLTDAVAISTGNVHTCALKADRTMVCWGSNFSGQLGTDPNFNFTNIIDFQTTASQVIGLTDAVALSAGNYHTCAVKANGSAACWGSNRTGELGDGTTVTRVIAGAVIGLTDAVAISAGGIGGGEGSYELSRTCALKANGSVACWGDKGFDNNGNAPIQNQLTPALVAGLTNTAALSAGGQHNCALKTDGAIACWGDDFYGQLGDGSIGGIQTSLAPVIASSNSSALLADVKQITTGIDYSCALKTDGAVLCWGSNRYGQLGDPNIPVGTQTNPVPTAVVNLGTDNQQISAGDDHSCVLKNNGNVLCWGANTWAQLGDPSVQVAPQANPTPTLVLNLGTGTQQISAGALHTCALKTDGKVLCWGYNGGGQLGDPNTLLPSPAYPTPTVVVNLGTDIKQISAGAFHTCALKSSNANVLCWGSNQLSQLGDANIAVGVQANPIPSAVVNLGTDTQQISAGYNHTCALKNNGNVLCWGSNSSGELSLPLTTPNLASPTSVIGLGSGIVKLSAGGNRTCVLTNSTGVLCWGGFVTQQFEDGGSSGYSQLPSTVVGLNGIDTTQISAGTSHTCALKSSGNVLCWGGNAYGELGAFGNPPRYINIRIKPEPTPVLGGPIFWN
jgi:alpha-tubulin suppressor-like RCC1 family protein